MDGMNIRRSTVRREVVPGAKYVDPETYAALARIEKEQLQARKEAAYRPLVYICSPYSGDTEANAYRARCYCRLAVVKKAIPFAPHLLLPQFMSEDTERQLALFMGNIFMGKCDEVWVFGKRISDGMAWEIERAERMRKKIRYFTEEMEEVSGDVNNA